MSLIYRQLVLTNNINRIVYLREAQEAAAEGHYGHETRLDPNSVKRDFPATVYQDRNRDSRRSSEIVIFVGEDKALRSLTPENFIQYVELIFEMNDNTKTLTVRGVPAEGLADDILRLGGLPRRDYSHRKRVIVLSCGFKANEVKNKSQTSAGDAADRAKDKAHEAEGRGKGVATTVVDKTKEAAGNVADTTYKGVAHGAKENTEKVVDGAADAAQSVGDRAKQTAEKIKETVLVGKADEAQSRR
ncbi:uncharacterized protein [Primulina eburnea]|uniref:uncharacterized protein isoform X2 n=1 Tax=Primulina eburnea TaxID=1245227 RepID=UPI003C6C3347